MVNFVDMSSNNFQYEKYNLQWNLKLPISILIEALTHPSYKSIESSISDNQRLETLGDAVIDLLVIEWLYRHRARDEGILTKSRAEVVQNQMLSQIAEKIQIQTVLRRAPGYKIQEKDLADAVEAIFGAKYLEGGLNSCQSLFQFLFEKDLIRTLSAEESGIDIWGRNELNPKNILNEFFQQKNLPIPIYKLQKKEGSEHDPIYWYSCEGKYQNMTLTGKGSGKSKKEAQKRAASNLYHQLKAWEVKTTTKK
jgi:ribonuclease-3